MRGEWIKDGNGNLVWHEFWNGYSAKHYWLEQTEHKEYYILKYPTSKEAEKYLKKIAKHFKVRITWDFNNRKCGHAFSRWYGGHISLPYKDISLGFICHEIAHLLAQRKWNKCCHHNRKFQTQAKRVYRWAKRYLPINPLERIEQTAHCP